MITTAWLGAALLAPVLFAAALAWPATRRAGTVLAPWAAAPALLCVALLPEAAMLESPMMLLGLRLGLDTTGRVFLLLTSLLWLAAGLAARAYHRQDDRQVQLWAWWLLTLAGNQWLVLALDAPGFYAGFALMTFSGYGVVVHAGSTEAVRAGRIYLVMALLGEAALLGGLLLAIVPGGTALPLAPAGTSYATFGTGLMFIGFGVKAGVVGLHMWLPLAHPVAPTPASAVLSGAMIKAGVLGWMRFLPLGAESWPALGSAAMSLGAMALFAAVTVGLVQRAPKTILAYSSVSQMGFLTIGIGAGLLAPDAWPVLAPVVCLYALHHGLAKGALFLGVAAAPGAVSPGRRLALALPALSLAGAPFTSGALAKYQLKEALVALPDPWLTTLEWLLPAAAVGTTLLMARFLLALAAAGPARTRGLTGPWLLAVAVSTAVPWLAFAPGQGLVSGPQALTLALLPVIIGAAAAYTFARRSPFGPATWATAPAGDVLVWLEPASRRAWHSLLQRLARRPVLATSTVPALALSGIMRAEDLVRRRTVAGLLLLLLLVLLAMGILLAPGNTLDS